MNCIDNVKINNMICLTLYLKQPSINTFKTTIKRIIIMCNKEIKLAHVLSSLKLFNSLVESGVEFKTDDKRKNYRKLREDVMNLIESLDKNEKVSTGRLKDFSCKPYVKPDGLEAKDRFVFEFKNVKGVCKRMVIHESRIGTEMFANEFSDLIGIN